MKKGIALLLAALVLLFTGTAAFAEGGSGLQKGDTVYLGRWQDAPIRWTVLDPDATNAGGNGLFLLCEQALTNQGVIYSWTKAVWQGSEGQTWCSALLEQSFSAAEQAAVPAVSKSEEGLQQYGLSWGPVELENEKVFFLSVRELGDYIRPQRRRSRPERHLRRQRKADLLLAAHPPRLPPRLRRTGAGGE